MRLVRVACWLLVCGLALPGTAAPQVAAPMATQRSTDPALVARAEQSVRAALGKPARLAKVTMNTQGDWAFFKASLRNAQGGPFRFEGTPLAEAARNGGASNTYVGLYRRQRGTWVKVEEAIAPTDVAWEDWGARHRLAPALFALPEE